MNLALEHPVYASGLEVNHQTFAADAVDGKLDTHWSGNKMKVADTADSWIVVDLGEDVCDINEVSSSYYAKVWPSDYVVQVAGSDFVPTDYSTVNVGTVSDESAFEGQNAKVASCWTTIGTYTGMSGDGRTDALTNFEAAIPEGTRYLRLYFTGINQSAFGHSIGLNELEVTGTRYLDPTEPGEPEDVVVETVMPSVAYGRLNTAFDDLELPVCAVVALSDGTTLRFPVEWSAEGRRVER